LPSTYCRSSGGPETWTTAIVLFYVLLAAAVFAFIFRAQLRVWWIRRKLKALSVPTGSFEPPVLTTRLYELDKVFVRLS
jgi:hypothetical protein